MSDLVERWPGYNEQSWAQRFAELDRRFSKERDTAVKAICQLSEQQSARIQALETSLAEAEGRVIAEVVKWLRGQADAIDRLADEADGIHLHGGGPAIRTMAKARREAATALETGEWKK